MNQINSKNLEVTNIQTDIKRLSVRKGAEILAIEYQ